MYLIKKGDSALCFTWFLIIAYLKPLFLCKIYKTQQYEIH